MTRRKVVLTGAAGIIAELLLPELRERYDLTLLDIRTVNREGKEVEGIQVVDLLNRDRDSYREYFRGADAVVHCGFIYIRGFYEERRFWAELSNVELAYNVYQTASEEGVRRVVVASSECAADYYRALVLDGKWDFVTPEMHALSDHFYGWAKVAIEQLGFVFAAGRIGGRALENVQIRIGGPRETDVARCPKGDLKLMRRALASYFSQRDMTQMFIKSIEVDDIRDENGVPFQVFFGISDNPHSFWSIVNARKIIGYMPEDNSEIRFADLVAEHIRAAQEQNAHKS